MEAAGLEVKGYLELYSELKGILDYMSWEEEKSMLDPVFSSVMGRQLLHFLLSSWRMLNLWMYPGTVDLMSACP